MMGGNKIIITFLVMFWTAIAIAEGPDDDYTDESSPTETQKLFLIKSNKVYNVTIDAAVKAVLDEPGAIGGTTAAAGTFTTISAGGGGFTSDADGDVEVKSLTTTQTTDPEGATFREGSAGGTNYIRIEAQTARTNNSTYNKQADVAGPDALVTLYTAAHSSAETLDAGEASYSYFFVTGTMEYDIEAVANLPHSAMICLKAGDTNVKTFDPANADRIRREDMTAQSDGVTITWTPSTTGDILTLVKDGASGWTVWSAQGTVAQGS